MERSSSHRNEMYIDIHSHIIFDVDDGSESLEESIRMLGMSYREGITGIIATPHFGGTNSRYDYDKICEHINILKKAIKKLGVEMSLLLGNEIYWNPGVMEELEKGNALTMAKSRYVLVEFSVSCQAEDIEDAIRRLVSEGYRPIIAHYERYVNLIDDLKQARLLVDMGAYVQINTRSFIQGKRDKRFKWVRELLLNDLIHFIASDAHNTDMRRPMMKEAVRVIEEIAGKDMTKIITKDNVVKLIKDQYI